MFDQASILITGGTGSLGNAIIPRLLKEYDPKKVIVYSRDEMKQWEMQKKFSNDPRIRFFIGDVRDKERLYRALNGVDYVIHAAATKIVPTAEYNPFECIKTNINGAVNVIDACLDNGVKKVVALSTDKASSPINLYGATKLASDKLFVAANAYSGEGGTKFCVVRYGNVLGSRGSVIPLFLKQSASKSGKLTVTDARMTRFMITLDQGVDLIFKAFSDTQGGEIYVKRIPSMNIMDIARSVQPRGEIETIGIRPGEKLHEQMIGLEDAPFTYKYGDYFKILPAINDWSADLDRIKDGEKVSSDFTYSSDNNDEWMSVEQLQNWIEKNKSTFLEI
jgi:UDP-N-acetylglucosamine 4,6-dehydratase (inverting)